MFKRWFGATLTCLLAVVMLGSNSSSTEARYGRVGHNLMCVCSCGQVLLSCNHVGCPDSARMIGELREQVSAADGGSDKAILSWFAAKYGATVLAAPIRGGFDNLAWILPFGLFVAGIFGTALVARLWARRRRLAPVAGFPEEPVNDPVRGRIRRETEWR